MRPPDTALTRIGTALRLAGGATARAAAAAGRAGIAAGRSLSGRQLTQQRLDPLGALAAWPLAPVVALVVLGYATTATFLQADEVRVPAFAVLALVALALSAGALVFGAMPARAPFEFRMHVLMIGLALTAEVFEQASRWGHNALIQDDFGQIGIGLFLLALAPYRPWREIAFSGVLAAAVVGSIAVAQASTLSVAVPPAIFALVAATQVLAPAVAGAAYSRRIVRSILAWQTDARRAILERSEEARGQVTRSVVERQLTTLRTGVLPFLEDVLERGAISPSDIERAGVLANEVRQALVAEIDSTWLDVVVARERVRLTAAGKVPLLVVADTERRATGFEAEQRAATAALIVALCAMRGFDPGSLVVQITGSAPTGRSNGNRPAVTRPDENGQAGAGPADTGVQVDTVTIQAGIDLPARQLRALLRPFLGVLRVLFVRVRVSVRYPLLTLEFDDERPAPVLDEGRTP